MSSDCFLMIRFWLNGWHIMLIFPIMGDSDVSTWLRWPPARFLLKVFKGILFPYKEEMISRVVLWDHVTLLFPGLSPSDWTPLVYIALVVAK